MRALSLITIMLVTLFWQEMAVAGTSNSAPYASIEFSGSYAEIEDIEAGGTLSDPVFSSNDTTRGASRDGSLNDFVGGLSAALGYGFGQYRLEIEYSFRYRFDVNGDVGRDGPGPERIAVFRSEAETQTLMLNLLWSFDGYYTLAGNRWQPYVGAGVGKVENETNTWLFNFGTPAETDSNTVKDAAWMLTIGARTEIDDRWAADLAYRYMDLGGIHIGPQSGGAEISTSGQTSHDLRFGFHYRF